MERLIKELLTNNVETRITVLKRMLNAMSDYIFIMEVKKETDSFIYLFANKKAMDDLGFDDSIYGKSLDEVLPIDRVSFLNAKYLEAITILKTIVFEDQFQVHGRMVYKETALNAIIIDEGRSIIVFSIVRDITKRKERECELVKLQHEMEKNQQRMYSLFEQNSDSVFELDLNGRIVSINLTGKMILGNKETELLGKTIAQMVAPEDQEKVNAYFQNAVKGIPQEYEISLLNRSGQKVFFGH